MWLLRLGGLWVLVQPEKACVSFWEEMTSRGFWTPSCHPPWPQPLSTSGRLFILGFWPPPHSRETVHLLPTPRLCLLRNCCPSIPGRPHCSPRPPLKPVGGDRPQEVIPSPAVSTSAPCSLQKPAQSSQTASSWQFSSSLCSLESSPTH